MKYIDDKFYPEIVNNTDDYDSIVTLARLPTGYIPQGWDPEFSENKDEYRIYVKKSINGYANAKAHIPFLVRGRKEFAELLTTMLFSTNMEQNRKNIKQSNIKTISDGELFIPKQIVQESHTICSLFMGEKSNILRMDKLSIVDTFSDVDIKNDYWNNYVHVFHHDNDKQADLNCMKLLAHIMFNEQLDKQVKENAIKNKLEWLQKPL